MNQFRRLVAAAAIAVATVLFTSLVADAMPRTETHQVVISGRLVYGE